MLTKKESLFLRVLLGAWIVLALIGLVTVILSIAEIWRTNSINNNIFELIFMGIHFIVLCFFIMVTIDSFKRGSQIIRGLAYSAHSGVSIPIRVASILIFILGMALVIMGILYLTPSGVYDFNFPITLKWAMVNSGLLLMVLMSAFFVFPLLFAKNPTISKKKENELNQRRYHQ